MEQVLLGTVAALGALLAFAAPASASLIQGPNLAIPGGGGTSNIILSLQSPGNSSLEAGSVTLAGCTGNTIGPCPGVANMLRTFSNARISSAAALTLFLDAAEPGSDNLITLTGLTLKVYGAGANNSTVFSAPFSAGVLPLNLIPSPGQETTLLTPSCSTMWKPPSCSPCLPRGSADRPFRKLHQRPERSRCRLPMISTKEPTSCSAILSGCSHRDPTGLAAKCL